jgi:hypothetical protein
VTRNDAITAATAALWGGHRDIKNAEAEAKTFVKVLEALGILKFEEESARVEQVLSALERPGGGPYAAHMIVERLRRAGFEIVKTKAAP